MTDSLVNRRLNGYFIESLLGRGGMARVYRGVDIRLQRYVAIKVIDAPFRSDPSHISRFEREAQVIARLGQHPNVVNVYHFGEDRGYLFIAMEYIEGADLAAVLQSYRRDAEYMPVEEILRITRDICSALDYVHSRGVIHRDLKPSNIMINPQGHAILTDFGLALFTQTGTLGEAFGSPHYISPEQVVSSAQAVRQSDLYSLGVMLFELFTNRLPFSADSTVDLAMQHMQQPPPPVRRFRPSVDPEVEAVIFKALSKSPEMRQRSGAELLAELEAALKAAGRKNAPPPTLVDQLLPAHVSRESQPLPPPTLPSLEQIQPAPPPTSMDRGAAPPGGPPKPVVIPLAPHKRRGSRIARLILLLGFIVAAALLCAGSVLAFNLLPNLNLTAMITTTTPTTVPSATAVPTEEIRPTPTTAANDTPVFTSTPVLSPTPAFVYEITLTKHNSTFLSVANTGAGDFPLPPLRIGRGADAIPGIAWGIRDLEPGDCVGAVRLARRPKLPDDLNCRLLGMIEGNVQVRLWDGNFDVFYEDKKIGECKEKDDVCVLQIVIP